MGFRRPATIMAIAGTLVLGTAVAAFADSGSGLAYGGNACAGPILVQPGTNAEETGSAFQTGTGTPGTPTSVKWSIWTNSTDDLNTATRAITYQAPTLLLQAVYNPGPAAAYYWGCVFNNSNPHVEINWSVTITGT
jgi:hypothetical protein